MSGRRSRGPGRHTVLLAVVTACAVLAALFDPGPALARATADDEGARIDVNLLRASGLAWATASPSDIGQPADVFDGEPATLLRSAGVNPAFVQVAFDAAVTFTGFRTLFSHAGGDPAYQWKVEVANSTADLQCRCRSFAEVVPFTGTVSDQFSAVTLSAPVTARLVRLTAQRLTGDDFVHLDEWELIGRTPFDVLNGPRGVAAADDGDVFVAESAADRVVRFGADGQRRNTIGQAGSGPGQLREPWDVAVDPCGDVTVADRGNHRIQVFDPAGAVVRVFGGAGSGAGQLDRPAGVAVQVGAGDVPAQVCTRRRSPAGGSVPGWCTWPTRVTTASSASTPTVRWTDGGAPAEWSAPPVRCGATTPGSTGPPTWRSTR